MDKTLIDESTLTNIGNAIREKTKDTALIAPGDMPAAIAAIPSGTPTPWTGQSTILWPSIKLYDTTLMDAYETYGPTLIVYAGNLSATNYIDFRSCNKSQLVKWLSYLPEGGKCMIQITSTQSTYYLTEEEKTAVTNKGYTWDVV